MCVFKLSVTKCFSTACLQIECAKGFIIITRPTFVNIHSKSEKVCGPDYALQPKKSAKKRVNLDNKILHRKFFNYPNPENCVSEGISNENIQCLYVFYLRFQQYLNINSDKLQCWLFKKCKLDSLRVLRQKTSTDFFIQLIPLLECMVLPACILSECSRAGAEGGSSELRRFEGDFPLRNFLHYKRDSSTHSSPFS